MKQQITAVDNECYGSRAEEEEIEEEALRETQGETCKGHRWERACYV